MLSWTDFPPEFVVWKLNPTGCTLTTKEQAPGVFALLSSIPGVDNAGFVVGEKAVLVIDAHISIPMARQIQERVREVTDKPIRYLVNSNYHADHTFGNCAFPPETLVIQQRETAVRTPHLQEEWEFMLPAVNNDPTIFEGVTLRLPDIVFDDYLCIDLGGRTVELYWFGPANTPGDTITYVPGAKVAWTGNMTGGSFGLALESDAPTFLGTLIRFIRTIEVERLIPGHAPILGPSDLWLYLLYFSQLTSDVKKALSAGWTLEETIERTPMGEAFMLPPSDPRANQMKGRHSYNVRRTYLSLVGR
jgi:glyoxylase-like metal-dependent hydrolase (beta-lactamase superfamily II)